MLNLANSMADDACHSELLRVTEPVISTTSGAARPAESRSLLDTLAAFKVQILCCTNIATLAALVVLAVTQHSSAHASVTVATPTAPSGASRNVDVELMCASGLPPHMLAVQGGGADGPRRNRAARIPCYPTGTVLLAVRGAAVSEAAVAAAAHPETTTLGQDVSGVVVASGCAELNVGDEVFGLSSSGSFAQFAVADCIALAKRPYDEKAPTSLKELGALPSVAGASYELLSAAGAPWSDAPTVFIAVGASPTGAYLVQLAKALGAGRVVTTAPSDKRALLASLGADEVVESSEALVTAAMDAAASSDGAVVAVDNGVDVVFGLEFPGRIGREAGAPPGRRTFEALARLTSRGEVRPVLAGSFAITDSAAALRAFPLAVGSTTLDVPLAVCGTFHSHWSAHNRPCPERGVARVCTGQVGGGPSLNGMGGLAIQPGSGGLCMCANRCWDHVKQNPEPWPAASDRAECPTSEAADCVYA